MSIIETEKLKAASEKLAAALTARTSGHVCRVAVTPEQALYAGDAARLRRTAAKLAIQNGVRDYSRAAASPDSPAERARLCTDRRAMLSELVVGDLLSLSGRKFGMQPLVSQTIEPGADFSYDGAQFEIKSAGQLSTEWHGCKSYGRLTDDARLMINCRHHAHYLEDAKFGGYLCAYLYIENNAPAAMDLFFFSAAQVSAARRNPGRIGAGGEAMDYYSLSLPFPDTRHSDDLAGRLMFL